MSLGKEWLSAHNKFYVPPLVCINPKPLSFIIGNTDIDYLSPHLPISSPISPVLNVGLVSVDTEMTDACEIPLNQFAIKLILTCVDSNIPVDQVEGPVQGAVDFLQHPFAILTGSSLLQISIFYFSWLCIDPPKFDLPTCPPISSLLNANMMSASKYFYRYSSGLLKFDRLCRVLNKPSS